MLRVLWPICFFWPLTLGKEEHRAGSALGAARRSKDLAAKTSGRRGNGRPLGRRHIASITVLVGLVVMTGLVDVFWGHGILPQGEQDRVTAPGSPFPSFPVNQTLQVVRVSPSVNYSTRLTLLSLQGIVNREGVQLYLDFRDEVSDAGSILNFISDRYGVTYDVVSVEWVLSRYLSAATGLFVYDPERPESVNIGTMYAALRGWAITGQETVAMLREKSGLPILMDYSTSPWSQMNAIETYERALQELRPPSDWQILAILPPENLTMRDYLIASEAFVFYYSQGPLAWPQEQAATLRILHTAPRGIPVLGWFNSTTETEENHFVQMVSREGKYLVGGYDTPNLSVLSSFGRNQTFGQGNPLSQSVSLDDKVYAVLGVADGDNLDYISRRMWELWHSPVRGSIPIAWSLNPLLLDLAPAYLDYYYGTATSVDSFVASPSGAGYLYPDFLGEGDIEPFLVASSRYLEATDMDVVWLLNSFPASETPFSQETLSAYVRGLEPRGLVLDYDDEPVTRNAWMQSGGDAAAPVIRSTHLWTTKENFLAKFQAAMDSRQEGPHFVWMTLYPWRISLAEAEEVIEDLETRTGGRLELVSPESFFSLLQADFRARARDQLQRMRADPFASILFPSKLDSAEKHLTRSRLLAQGGEETAAAFEAFLALESIQEAKLWEAILVMAVITLAAAGISVSLRKRNRHMYNRIATKASTSILIGATVAVFLLTVRSALSANFWTYHFVFLGIALSGFAPFFGSLLESRLQHNSPPLYAAFFLLSAGLALYTSAAFPLLAFAAVLLLSFALSGREVFPGLLLFSVSLGFAVGFLSPAGLLAMGLLSPFIVAPVFIVRRESGREASSNTKGAWSAGVALSLPLIALATSHYNSLGIRLGLEGDALGILGAALLVVSPIAALPLAGALSGTRTIFPGAAALSFSAMASALLLFSRGTLVTSLAFLAVVAGTVIFAQRRLIGFQSQGGNLASTARPLLAIIPLLLLFMRLPPVGYSLLFVPLPEVLEYALYAPQIIFAGAFAIVVLAIALAYWRGQRIADSEKPM